MALGAISHSETCRGTRYVVNLVRPFDLRLVLSWLEVHVLWDVVRVHALADEAVLDLVRERVGEARRGDGGAGDYVDVEVALDWR